MTAAAPRTDRAGVTRPIICVGAALIDDTYFSDQEPLLGTSNPSAHRRSAGGVARNVAHHLAQLGHRVELIAHFGSDDDGNWLARQCRAAGIGVSHAHFGGAGTGRYASIVTPGGELLVAAADTRSEEELSVAFLSTQSTSLAEASLLLLDCNLAPESIDWLLSFARARGIPCVLEPVSAPKAARVAGISLAETLLVTPNSVELAALAGDPLSGTDEEGSIGRLLARGVRYVWMRKGREGSLLASHEETISLPAPLVTVLDSTGAGDAALAGWIHAWLRRESAAECLRYGHAMAEIILQTRGANAERVAPELLASIVSTKERP